MAYVGIIFVLLQTVSLVNGHFLATTGEQESITIVEKASSAPALLIYLQWLHLHLVY